MERIVGNMRYVGKPCPDEWVVTTCDLGHGHREACIQQAIHWEEAGMLSPEAMELYEESRAKWEDERKEANARRAARRAKTKVRRLVKSMGLDTLLTLTYHANQTDQALCKRHLKEFVRRIRRVIPGFAYVAAFEQQERGAWHVHLAVHRLPVQLATKPGVKLKSYNVVRAIWRGVTGELGGNIDQSARKRTTMRSSAKLASYLSKYMMKAFEEGDQWSNRFSASSHDMPHAVRVRFTASSLLELVDLVYAFAADGVCEITTWLSTFKDTFYISSGPPPASAARYAG